MYLITAVRDWTEAERHGLNALNSEFLGPESVIYPFKNMNINEMVSKYLPLLETTRNDRNESYKDYKHVLEMFRTGKYGILERDYIGPTGKGSFKNAGIVIDGGRLKTEPWNVFNEIEQKIGLEPFFTKSHFTKRDDGFYCVVPGTKSLCTVD